MNIKINDDYSIKFDSDFGTIKFYHIVHPCEHTNCSVRIFSIGGLWVMSNPGRVCRPEQEWPKEIMDKIKFIINCNNDIFKEVLY